MARTLVRSPVVVGREAEVAELRELVQAAADARRPLVLLVGEAGSGKTRLLREVEGEAQRKGIPVLAGGAPLGYVAPAFGVLAQALRTWTRSHQLPEAELAPFAVGLRLVLPEWPVRSEPPALTPDQLRLLVLEGALRLLRVIGRGAGVLLTLDDLHAADAETWEFLVSAAPALARERVLVVGALRDAPEGRARRQAARALARRDAARIIDVPPLGLESVSAMIAAILGAEPPAGFAADLMGRTDGVPLLVEEMVQAHLAAGTLRAERGRFEWSGRDRRVVPRTELELARERMSALSADARLVVSAAAVLGSFDGQALAATTGLALNALAAALRETEGSGLLDTATTPSFRHALIREAVLEALVPVERRDLHRRAAAALERPAGDAALLERRAMHLAEAADQETAAGLLLAAARDSRTRHALLSAERQLRAALALTADAVLRSQAHDALAEVLGALGRWEEALAVDRESLASAGAERLARMARHAVLAGRSSEADELLAGAATAGAAPGPLRALAALAALWRGDLERAVSESEAALADPSSPPETICAALDVNGRAADALGRRDDARRAFARWVEVAERSGLAHSRLQALMERGNVDFLAGGPSDGLVQARDLAREMGAFTTLVLADLSLTWWYGRRARLDAALAAADEAVDLCGRLMLDLLPHALVARAWVQALREPGTEAASLSEAERSAPDDTDVRILTAWVRGDAAMHAGRAAEAAGHYITSAELMRGAPSSAPPPGPFMLPCALLLAGRDRESRAALEDARRSPAVHRQYVNAAWVAIAEALAIRDADAFESAIARIRESATMDAALALTIAATLIRAPRAREWVREALVTFDDAGMKTDSERGRRLLRALGGHVPAPRRRNAVPADLAARGVSEREWEVLRLVRERLSNADIAARLFVSVRTVESHVSALLRKLGGKDRTDLVRSDR